jgi:CheY-like chemotaxis protein
MLNESQSSHIHKILIVDDSEAYVRLMESQLKKEGAEVVTVPNGREAVTTALQHARESKAFDIIFMDMNMPEMNGYAATRKLRQEGYQGPIVALTANDMQGDREKCLNAGCNGYAQKPINKPNLLAIISEFTG